MVVSESGCYAAPVPTSRTLSQPSITGGPLISLLFCHAHYSRLMKGPPNVLNDRASIERGQMAEGEESQSLSAEWHLNSLFSTLQQQLFPPPLQDFLPGYFSLLFPHQNGAINWQVKHDRTKAQMKRVKRVISPWLNVIGAVSKHCFIQANVSWL